MSCGWTQTRLIDYLDGGLDGATRQRVEAHLVSCTECAGYAEELGHVDESSEAWTQQVLERTANGACKQSVGFLPAWLDGELDEVETDLTAGHVAHCRECATIAGAMRKLNSELPLLAEFEPDPAFLDDVLAATLPRPVPVALPWAARIDAWFVRLLQRPRIAWEGAYLATAVLALLVVFPGSPLAGVPQKALDVARTDPTSLEQPFVAFKTNLNTGAQEALFTTRTAVRSIAVRANAGYGDAKRGIGTLWDRIASDALTDEMQEDASTNGESK